VMVSHEDWHRKYFDRVIYMRDGKIVTDEEHANPLGTG
jgi:putative ABC transport system ATP-binding protein